MTDRAHMLNDIAETADALAETRQHTERTPYWDSNRNRKYHTRTVTLPSLIDQLVEQGRPTNTGGGGGGRSAAPASRPPGDLDAIACHAVITVGAAKWLWEMRIPLRDTAAGNVRAMVGAASNADSDTQAGMLADLRHWLRWAETSTGWRIKPYTLVAPCPNCEVRGHVRMQLDDKTASCAACGQIWDEAAIDVLVNHEQAWLESSSKRARDAWARIRKERAERDEALRLAREACLAQIRAERAVHAA